MTLLFLIRHGQTVANRLTILQGTLDNELTDLTSDGQSEAKRDRQLLSVCGIQRVFTSPLHRAVTTSQIICRGSGLPLMVDSRLAEISYGDWNGASLAGLKHRYADCFNPVTDDLVDKASQFNHGESFAHARHRILSFVRDVSQRYPDQRLLVVTHGWIIKNLVAACLPQISGTDFNDPANLSLTKVEVGPAASRVDYYNRQLDFKEELR